MSLSSADLTAFRDALRGFDPNADDAARFERIHLLEQVRAAASAAQAVEVAAFVTSRRAAEKARIVASPVEGVGSRVRIARAEKAIVNDVALARRESPAQASRFIRFAQTAPTELPQVFRLFSSGGVSRRRMLALHHATAWLEPQHRQQLDTEIAAELPSLGDVQVTHRAQTIAQRLDPAGACERAAKASNERHVTLRPAPESMTWLTALLPLTQGVAAYAALDQAAGSARAAGDQRGRGQVMADTLVERVTGQATSAAVPIAVKLVMTDHTLLGTADDPGRIVGHGPIPAALARDLVLADTTAARSMRRLFTDPAGRLITMESDARCFTPAMAEFIRVRDDLCQTPWCNAPIRHLDHTRPAADGGPTSVEQGRGLCEHCNYAAQTAGLVSVLADHLRTTQTRPPGTARPPDPDLSRQRSLHHATYPIEIVWGLGSAHAA